MTQVVKISEKRYLNITCQEENIIIKMKSIMHLDITYH